MVVDSDKEEGRRECLRREFCSAYVQSKLTRRHLRGDGTETD